MSATLPPSIKFQPLVAGQPLPGGKVYFYAAGTSTPQSVFAADGITPLTNPVILDANGATDFRLGSGLSYKINLTNAADVQIAGWPADLIDASDKAWVTSVNLVRSDLASTADVALGDAIIGVKHSATNAVPRTQHGKNSDSLTVKDTGAAGVAPAGDGVTVDTAPLAAFPADRNTALIPSGSYKTTKADLPTLHDARYTGDGKLLLGDVLATLLESSPDSYSQLAANRAVGGSVAQASLSGNSAANVSTLCDALMTGTAKVVFIGDSITAQDYGQCEYESAWVRQTMHQLNSAFQDVAFTFVNLGITSAGSGNLIDPAFVPGTGVFAARTAPTTYPVGLGYWPAGSSAGVSWLDHAKNQAPDLLVVSIGMNDAGTLNGAFIGNIENLITTTRTWTKKPTILLVNQILPTRLTAPYTTDQIQLEGFQRSVRHLASKHKCLLLDVHRMFRFLRDGVDDRCHYFNTEKNLQNYATWWTQISGVTVSQAGGIITSTGDYKTLRNQPCRDCVIDATVTITNAGQIPSIYWRIPTGYTAPLGGYALQWLGNDIQIYYNGGLVTSVSPGACPLSTAQYFRVECIEDRIRVWRNGTVIFDLAAYHTFQDGKYGVGIGGAVAASATIAVSSKTGFPSRSARPLLGDVELLGPAVPSDPIGFDNNPDSPGGNSLNHPSRLAHLLCYLSTLGGVIGRIVGGLQHHSKTAWGTTDIARNVATYAATGDSVTISGEVGEKYQVDVVFPYLNGGADSGLLEIMIDGVAAPGSGYVKYLDPTVTAHGRTLVWSYIYEVAAAGTHVISLAWQSGASLTNITSPAASTVHFVRSLTVRKM